MNTNRCKETYYRMANITLFILLIDFLQIVCLAMVFYVLFYYEVMTVDDLKSIASSKITIWEILLLSIVEEVIFRKWILNFLVKRKIKYSNTIQALLFAVAHQSIIKIPITFLFGLIMGNVYLKERRLVYPIFLHIITNLGVEIISGFVADSMNYVGLVGLGIALCILIISIYVVWRKIDIKLFQL